MKIPDIFVPEKNLEGNIEKLMKKPQEPIGAQPEYDKFEIIKVDTYAEGIAMLRERGKRPFTFAENVVARIADYKANGKDAELFKTWLDSVTGIAYKAKSTKFKIISRSDKLENIAKGFNQSFIPINYNVEKGVEFDSKKGEYNQLLTREEVKNHEFWLAVMNGDKEKLARYVDIWFDKTKAKEGMGVYLRSNIDEDGLRGLALYYGDYSSASGDNFLNDLARFVSGAQQK